MKTQLYQPKPYEKRGLNKDRLAAVLAHAGDSILDVGCGNGVYVLELMDRYDIKGLDFTKSPSWDKQPDRFLQCNATQLPFEDKSFDSLISFETLEHLTDPESVLKEYYRVARKNLILTVPNCDISMGMKRSGFLYSHWGDPTHVNFFNMKSICELIKKVGFEISESYYINRINPAPLLLEALRLDGKRKEKLLGKILSRVARREYFITSLVVATKPDWDSQSLNGKARNRPAGKDAGKELLDA